MKHSEKVRIATKLNGGKRKGMFYSKEWESRKDAIKARVKRRQSPVAHLTSK